MSHVQKFQSPIVSVTECTICTCSLFLMSFSKLCYASSGMFLNQNLPTFMRTTSKGGSDRFLQRHLSYSNYSSSALQRLRSRRGGGRKLFRVRETFDYHRGLECFASGNVHATYPKYERIGRITLHIFCCCWSKSDYPESTFIFKLSYHSPGCQNFIKTCPVTSLYLRAALLLL